MELTEIGPAAAQPRRQASVLLHFGQIRLWAPSEWKRVLHIKHFRSFRVSTSTISFNCSCISIAPNPLTPNLVPNSSVFSASGRKALYTSYLCL